MDGLEYYGSEYLYIRFQSALLERVSKLEGKAQILAASAAVLSRQDFAEKHALLVERFMLGVQNLLGATSTDRNDYALWARRLTNQDFAHLLWEFYQAPNALGKILILASGFEDWSELRPYFSPAALRSVTTLARFLDPDFWGAACWRTMACLGFESMTELKQVRLHTKPASIQREFGALSAGDIVDAMKRMRALVCEELPNTASVAAALYCISLDVWPTDVPFERPDPLGGLPFHDCQSLSATV
jgi:hypothetical protein